MLFIVNVVHESASTSVEALDQILELVVLLNEDMTQTLARDGLTVPRARLAWLLHHGGATTQRALADGLKVTPRNITGLVDGLAAAGLVTREPHPTDRRATLVSLTERGSSTMTAMDRSHRELAALLFGNMADREFACFARGLGHVLRRLRQELHASGVGGR
jgi:DNA-binding MarR family transcriptional regulator